MKRIIKDVLIIAGATAISRILGLIRDIVIANKFGAGADYDAYIIAFFVPHMLRRLLAEGALSTAFIPLFTGYLRQGREAANRFAGSVLNLGLMFFPLFCLAGILTAPYYIPFLADGFGPEKLNLTIKLTQVVFPFIGLVGIAAIFGGILNSYRHFFAPAFAPVLFNLGAIAGAVFIASFFKAQIFGLGVGVLVGGLGMLTVQALFLRGKLNYTFSLKQHEGIKRLLWMMLPVVMSLAITQINILVDNKLASRLGDGSVSALQYAIRLFQLPLGVFAVSISSAILPRLSAAADDTELADMVKKGIQMCAFWLLPATAGLYVLGKPIIQLLFEHGSFSHADTLRTWYALKYYLVGMIGYGLVYVLTRAFYSKGDTKTPVWIGALAVIINIILNYALIGPMREGGLALATSIAGLVNMALLGVVLQQRLKVSLVVNLGQMALASALMGALTYLFYRWLASFLGNELLLAGLPLLFGILAYLAFSKLGGFLLIRR